MTKIMKEKDEKIEGQRAEITNLRKKNFDFKAKMVKISEKSSEQKKGGASEIDAMASMQMAMQLHQ